LDLTYQIKNKTIELGFQSCGIARTEYLHHEAIHFRKWLDEKKQASMKYMENNLEMRLDPRLLVPNAKSVISLLYNYYPSRFQFSDSKYKISKYAYGEDYHVVIKKKLFHLIDFIHTKYPEAKIRACVDSAPVLERAWAVRSGLGWVGKNTNLITKQGSYFFICELITDIELEYDAPFSNDYCGNCSRCMDACPMQAITKPHVLDASRCISYLTIEMKDEFPDELKGKYTHWIAGCDVCQDVCPWNKFSSPHNEPSFVISDKILTMTSSDWENLDEQTFNNIFSKSAIKRTKFQGLKRNISVLIE